MLQEANTESNPTPRRLCYEAALAFHPMRTYWGNPSCYPATARNLASVRVYLQKRTYAVLFGARDHSPRSVSSLSFASLSETARQQLVTCSPTSPGVYARRRPFLRMIRSRCLSFGWASV